MWRARPATPRQCGGTPVVEPDTLPLLRQSRVENFVALSKCATKRAGLARKLQRLQLAVRERPRVVIYRKILVTRDCHGNSAPVVLKGQLFNINFNINLSNSASDKPVGQLCLLTAALLPLWPLIR